MTEVKFEKVTKYDRKQDYLTEVDFNFTGKTVVALCKPEDQDISRLYGLILGEEKPNEGTVTVNELVPAKNKKELSKVIAYETADSNLGKAKTVRKALENAMENQEHPMTMEQAEQLIVQFKMQLDTKISDLDEEQIQELVLIADAIAGYKILLLDHPTDKLDENHQRMIWTLLRDFAVKTDALIIFNADSVAEMQLYADKIAYFNHGKLKKIREVPTHDSVDSLVTVRGQGLPIDQAEQLGATILQETVTQIKFLYAGNIQTLLPLLEQDGITDVRIADASIADELSGV